MASPPDISFDRPLSWDTVQYLFLFRAVPDSRNRNGWHVWGRSEAPGSEEVLVGYIEI